SVAAAGPVAAGRRPESTAQERGRRRRSGRPSGIARRRASYESFSRDRHTVRSEHWMFGRMQQRNPSPGIATEPARTTSTVLAGAGEIAALPVRERTGAKRAVAAVSAARAVGLAELALVAHHVGRGHAGNRTRIAG